MSLYNMMCGYNGAAGTLMTMIGLKPSDTGRFRDCYLSKDGTKILVYTRNGGGNRPDHMPDFSKHPQFVRDYDDDFDNTFATIEFQVPKDYEEMCKNLAATSDTRTGAERMNQVLEELKSGADTPSNKRVMDIGKRVCDQILRGESGDVSTPDGSIVIHQIKPNEPNKP